MSWWRAASRRALKTMGQTLASLLTVDAVVPIWGLDWTVIVGATLLAGAYSLATSLAGLPEVEGEAGA